MNTGHFLATVAAVSLVLGACTTTDPSLDKEASVGPDPSTCFGVNTNFYFVATKYQRPWLENSSAPFTFANLFDFGLLGEIERKVTYARLQADRGKLDLTIVLLSSSNEVVFKSLLRDAHLACTQDHTIVKHSDSVHGADSFGGSERTITVTLRPADGLTHATSRVEGVSRLVLFFMIPIPMEPVEIWAQFRRSG